MKQSKFEVDRMKDENDRFFAFLKVVEKENKDDQIFKQGFDSLLKEMVFFIQGCSANSYDGICQKAVRISQTVRISIVRVSRRPL